MQRQASVTNGRAKPSNHFADMAIMRTLAAWPARFFMDLFKTFPATILLQA